MKNKRDKLNKEFEIVCRLSGFPEQCITEMQKNLSEPCRAQLTERIRDLHDASIRAPLTGDYNRAFFIGRLKEALEHVSRSPEKEMGLLFIDLDRFKQINDTLGHHVGDQMLLAVSQTLREHTRGDEIVARLGGDEFCILLHKGTSAKSSKLDGEFFLNQAARRICDHIRATTISHEGKEISVGASIGAVLINKDTVERYKTVERFIADADRKMYDAKRAQGGVSVLDNSPYSPIYTTEEGARFTPLPQSPDGGYYCEIPTGHHALYSPS